MRDYTSLRGARKHWLGLAHMRCPSHTLHIRSILLVLDDKEFEVLFSEIAAVLESGYFQDKCNVIKHYTTESLHFP